MQAPGGHYARDLTLRTLSAKFYWKGMSEDVRRVTSARLHCLPTLGGQRIPRPLGTAVHGQRPNQVLHFDFLFIRSGRWLFVLKDDFSGFVTLTPCGSPDSQITTQALLEWRAMFGTPNMFVSDQGSYFVGEVMRTLVERIGVEHHLTTAYIHYPNGTVEVVNKLVLQAIRTLISELRWKKEEWESLIPVISHYLNHKPQARLAGHAPVTVHTGLPRDDPLELIFQRPDTLLMQRMSSSFIETTLSDLQDHLMVIHHDVEVMTEQQRERHRKLASKNRLKVNFQVGDYVLIAKNVTKSNSKLYLTWKGPFHILSSRNGYVFKVADIVTQETRIVHGERMKLYADSSLDVTEPIKLQKSFDDESFIIEKVLDVKDDCCFIKWLGFTEAENSWEPLEVILSDAPLLLKQHQESVSIRDASAPDLLAKRRRRG